MTARREETSLECLNGFLRRMQRKGLVTHTDDMAAARRRYAYLIGPTAIRETRQKLQERVFFKVLEG